MLLLVMINLLIEKAKKIIENKRITDDDASSVTASRLDPKVFDDVELKETIYGKWKFLLKRYCVIDINFDEPFFSDIIKTIKDPEKPATLEELNVIQEDDIYVGTRLYCISIVKSYPCW